MPDWVIKYFGEGVIVLLGYIIISNSLWLIFGSKLLQSLPGVNIKGAKGTLKIVLLLVLTLIGFFIWLFKWPFSKIGLIKNQSLPDCIGYCIQIASKVFSKRS